MWRCLSIQSLNWVTSGTFTWSWYLCKWYHDHAWTVDCGKGLQQELDTYEAIITQWWYYSWTVERAKLNCGKFPLQLARVSWTGMPALCLFPRASCTSSICQNTTWNLATPRFHNVRHRWIHIICHAFKYEWCKNMYYDFMYMNSWIHVWIHVSGEYCEVIGS